MHESHPHLLALQIRPVDPARHTCRYGRGKPHPDQGACPPALSRKQIEHYRGEPAADRYVHHQGVFGMPHPSTVQEVSSAAQGNPFTARRTRSITPSLPG